MTIKNPKAKGTHREMKVRDRLGEQGYFTMRSAGSHGDFDVVGIRLGSESAPFVRLVQSKSNGGYTKQDVGALRVIRNLIGNEGLVRVELWDWVDGFREPVITIIGFNIEDDVVLFDGREFK